MDSGRASRFGIDMVVVEDLLSGLSGTSVTSTIAVPKRAIVLGDSTGGAVRIAIPYLLLVAPLSRSEQGARPCPG